MKNLVISFILFILMIVGILVSLNYLDKKCSYYGNMAASLEATINNESWDKAYDISKKFLEEWRKDSKTISAYINHLYIESINDQVLKLTQYIETKDKSESLAVVHEIKFFLEGILYMEKVTIPNIF